MLTDTSEAFEARYYLAESNKLREQSSLLLKQSDEFLQMSVQAWKRAKEQGT